VEGPLLNAGCAGSRENERSLVALLQVFVSGLRLFQGIETSGIKVISELVALPVIGETGVQGVEAEDLDFEVSHAWPVG
jgi:hypothetical protein